MSGRQQLHVRCTLLRRYLNRFCSVQAAGRRETRAAKAQYRHAASVFEEHTSGVQIACIARISKFAVRISARYRLVNVLT
jgi:hypothetical protein